MSNSPTEPTRDERIAEIRKSLAVETAHCAYTEDCEFLLGEVERLTTENAQWRKHYDAHLEEIEQLHRQVARADEHAEARVREVEAEVARLERALKVPSPVDGLPPREVTDEIERAALRGGTHE